MTRSLIALVLLATLSACGHKGPVVPLGEKLPVAPGKFTALQRGESFLLSWTLPTANQDGSKLDDLIGFDILRMDFDSDTPCSTCRDTSRQVGYVDLEYLQDAQRVGELISRSDSGIEPGRAYRYHVVAVNSEKRRGARATLDVIAHQPPLPPEGLQGEGLDRLVRLSWEEAGVPGADCNLLGYYVYRADAGEPFPLTPLKTGLVAGTDYEDLGVPNDVPLRYAIRSVLRVGEQEVHSTLSAEIEVTPQTGR